MTKALYISAYFPGDAIPAAGNKLAYTWLNEISRSFDVVDVVSFSNSIERDFVGKCSFPENVNVYIFNISEVNRIFSFVLHPFLPAGAAVRKMLARGSVKKLLLDNSYNSIYVDFTQAADVLPVEMHKFATLRIHDIVSRLYKTRSESGGIYGLLSKIEYKKNVVWEKNVLNSFNKINCLTDREKNIAIDMTNRESVDFNVSGISNVYRISVDRSKFIRGAIVFWGNMGRIENSSACVDFIKKILPIIKEKLPEAKFYAVGANPPEFLKRLESDSVVVTGFVDSPDKFFEIAHLGVVPLKMGAGIKIKTIEMLAAGIKVVATSIGAEGVVDNIDNLKVVDGENEFADACINIMRES